MSGRLAALQQIDTRLADQEQGRSDLARLEEELGKSRDALSAAREHQDQIRQLELNLAGLKQELEGARTEEALAGTALRQAETRVALVQWAEAAERCAEADPSSGRLAEVEQQCARADTERDSAARYAQELGRRLRFPAGAAAGGLMLSVGGAAAHQAVILGLAGLILAAAAIVWALGLGKRLAAARAAAAKAQRIGDALEGERQAILSQAAAAAEQRHRWEAGERECRGVLENLKVEIPPDAEGARHTVTWLPDVAVSTAQEGHQSAQAALNTLQARWEVANRTLDAERARASSVDVNALEGRITELEASHAQQGERLRLYEDLPAAIQALGLRSASELPAAMDDTRHEEAESAAAARALPGLEGQLQQWTGAEAGEREQSQQLAGELGITGADADAWSAAAQAEREAFSREAEATPDAVLEEAVQQAREALLEIQQQEGILRGEQARRRQELDGQSREALVTAEQECRAAIDRNAAAQRSFEDVRPALEAARLAVESPALRTELAVAQNTLERARAEARTLPDARAEQERRAQAAAQLREELIHAWKEHLDPPAPAAPDEAVRVLEEQRALAQQELLALNESDLREEDEQLQKEDLGLGASTAAWSLQCEQGEAQQRSWLEQLGQLAVDIELPLHTLPGYHPELAAVGEPEAEGWDAELQSREEVVRANRSDRRWAAQALGIDEQPLELAAEREALAQLERELAVRRRAGQIVAQTRQSIVKRVMPLTVQNMRLILPLLTEGRYQDAEWDEPGNFIAVYDSRAGSFQRKRVFSGGARDQISLALRLAFALATLPGEHNVRPGWLFLDEPLSSFDHSRTQALVELLTRGLVRRQFAQIFLISHSQSFDPSRFDYRIRMDGGQVVECTLPPPAATS